MTNDLNDLYHFVKVVDHSGFAPAGRPLNLPKSKLSRRIASLEEAHGVRLLQRSTRHFSVTYTGREFYAHCIAMLACPVSTGAARDHQWDLEGPDGATAQIRHRPRYITDDMTALRQAALSGIGVVQLPCMVVRDELNKGNLVEILPGWAPKGGIVHAVFPSRRGVLPAVRLLLDYLAAHIEQG